MPGSNRNWSVGAFFVLAFAMMSPVGFAQAAASPGLSGAELFKNNCALCHGDKGAGSVLGKRLLTPDLRSKEIHQKTPSALAQTISAGKKNMPPFASKLSSAEIEKLVAYVKQLHR
jgi:mono/diheme cytochrome c family protein